MICNRNTLIQVARCFQCLPEQEVSAAMIYLLCKWASAPPKVTCDPDALTFLTAAGISPTSTEGLAVCQLVADLKAYPAAQPAGNKYWDREIIIYPFVGGTSLAGHAVNLKSPGTYDLSWQSVGGLTASALGVASNGTGYGDTQYVLPGGASPRDALRAMFYLDTVDTGTGVYFGATNSPANTPFIFVLHGTPLYVVVAGATQPCGAAEAAGANFVQRISGTVEYNAMHGQSWAQNVVSSGTGINQSFYLLGYHANNNTVSNRCVCRISGFSLGTKFSDVIPTNTERLEYKGIWDTFQAALGRAHV